MAAFLPTYGHGATLLRIFHVAAALKSHGWRSLVLPAKLTLAQRRRLLRSVAPDIVVMQGARHPLNRPELYRGVAPIFYDMDDADFHLDHLAGAVCRAMPQVAGVIAGSTYIANWCRAAGAPGTHVVWTGAPPSTRRWSAQADRPPVIAWAQTRPMTYTLEAELVRRLVSRIGEAQPVMLRLYDRQAADDPGFAAGFEAPGVAVEWKKTCGYGDYLASLDDVAIGLAPLCPAMPFTRGKSFGKVLAYLDARVPVIGSDTCEHGAFFDDATGVITNDPARWVQAARDLLGNAAARQAMADTAHERFLDNLTVSVAARRLDGIFRSYLG